MAILLLPQPLPNPAPEPIEGGNRWDDAEGRFATVYCASRAEVAFGEVIARYRERAGLLERIDEFLGQRPDPEHDPPLDPGVVPADFFDGYDASILALLLPFLGFTQAYER